MIKKIRQFLISLKFPNMFIYNIVTPVNKGNRLDENIWIVINIWILFNGGLFVYWINALANQTNEAMLRMYILWVSIFVLSGIQIFRERRFGNKLTYYFKMNLLLSPIGAYIMYIFTVRVIP